MTPAGPYIGVILVVSGKLQHVELGAEHIAGAIDGADASP
jgi:hypothetical protein